MKTVTNALINVLYAMLALTTYVMVLDHRYLTAIVFVVIIIALNAIKKVFKLGVYKY